MRYDVFISYARKDGSEYAERLDNGFVTAGLKAWRDRRDLDPDQDFTGELEEGIENSDSVICCITPDTHRNDSFVRREIGYALAVRKAIVPVIFEDTIPPIHIINVTREDFTHTLWPQAFANLLARLQRRPRADDQQYTVPSDPFRGYLNALYVQIIDLLKHTVFSEIALYSDETEGAVNKRIRTALPVGFWQGAAECRDETERSKSFRNFGEAFTVYGQRVLLLGDSGAGKTTTLLAFARDKVAERLHDPCAPLPIIAPVSTWNSNAQTPIYEWLATQVPMLNREVIASHLQDRTALLMLDGLDELGRERFESVDGHNVAYDPRARFVGIVPEDGPVILSCRAKDYAEIGVQAALTGAVTLKPLSDAQIAEYLREVPYLHQAIAKDQELRDLVRTPLLLSIVTHAYKDNASSLTALSDLKAASGELRDRIFEDYVKSRFTHEQRHGNASLPFSIEEVYHVLGEAVLDGTEFELAGHTEYAIDLETAIKTHVGERIAIFVEEVTRLHLLISGPEQRLTFIHALLHDHFGFRYASKFLTSAEFGTSKDYNLRYRTLEFLAKSNDPRALEPLIEQLEPYIRFPLVYSLRVGDPRVLLAYARSLEVHDGDDRYDVICDVAPEGIRVVAEKLGRHTSALTLASAAQSATADSRAVYLYALAFLRLTEGLGTIVSATQDSDATVRGVAVWALGELGRHETLDVVERLLTDGHVVENWISWEPSVKSYYNPWGYGRFHFPWSSFPSSETRVNDLARATLTKLRTLADGSASE